MKFLCSVKTSLLEVLSFIYLPNIPFPDANVRGEGILMASCITSANGL